MSQSNRAILLPPIITNQPNSCSISSAYLIRYRIQRVSSITKSLSTSRRNVIDNSLSSKILHIGQLLVPHKDNISDLFVASFSHRRPCNCKRKESAKASEDRKVHEKNGIFNIVDFSFSLVALSFRVIGVRLWIVTLATSVSTFFFNMDSLS